MGACVQLTIAIITTLIVAFVACAGLISVADRFDLVDHPVGRKDHGAPIPVVGGIAIWAGLTAGAALLAGDSQLWVPLFAGLILVIVGIADDHHDLHWGPRILAQVVAASVLVIGGDAELTRLGYGIAPLTLELGWAAIPFSVFAVVGVINALNMIDGVDGLSGSLALTSLLVMLGLALNANLDGLVAPLALISAAVLVFLGFNWRLPGRPRALTFLGNSGSALLGLLLAWAAIRLTEPGHSSITPALGPWLVALPVLDCLGLIALRLADGRSPFAADRGHFHHLLLDRGWSVPALVLAAVTAQLAFATIGLLMHLAGVPDIWLIVAFLLLLGMHVLSMVILRQRNGRLARIEAQAAVVADSSSGHP